MFAKHIFKPLAGAALAVTVALTSLGASATPAAALSTEDLLRLLARSAVAQSQERAREEREEERLHWQQERNKSRSKDHGRWDRDGRRRDRPAKAAPKHKVLPASCRVSLDTRAGTRRYFSEQCLQRQTKISTPPRECLRYVQLDRRTIRAYQQKCMIDRGYKVKR